MFWQRSGQRHEMNHYLRLLQYLRPHIPEALLVLVLTLLSVATQGASVWVAAEVIEKVLAGGLTSAQPARSFAFLRPLDALARAVVDQPTPFATVVAAALALVGARLLLGGIQVARFVLISSVSQRILAEIRNSLFQRVTRVALSFSRQTRPGEVATVFLRDVDQLNEAFFDLLDRSIMQPARLLVIVGIMLTQSWMLTLWVIVLLAAGAVAVRVSGALIQRLCATTLRHISELQGHLVEYLSSTILARLLNREDTERRRFEGTSDSIRRGLVRIVFLRNLGPETVQLLFALAGGGILVLGGRQVFVSRTLEADSLLKLLLLLPLAAGSVEKLAAMYATMRMSLASASRVFDLLDLPLPPPDPPDAVEAGPFSSCLELREVEYAVGGRAILRGINLRLEKGCRLLVFGPSGSGKSTLLGLMAGVLSGTAGQISVDGVDLRRIRRESWRRKLGVVLQDPLLLKGTVRENLRYGCPDATERELAAVLMRIGLAADEAGAVRWLERQVGVRGENLSGGERQRLAMARALLTNPEILLLDEPTSMLDAVSKQQVLEAIRAATQGRSLVLVTHDPFLHELADVEVQLRDGQLVKTGPASPDGANHGIPGIDVVK
jgi:subfamily B ATP-binding cassette protein MsbA